VDQLLVAELLNAHAAEFAAVAGILDTAEGQFRIGPVDVVDEHSCRSRHPRGRTSRCYLRPKRSKRETKASAKDDWQGKTRPSCPPPQDNDGHLG
jgi:hypothetical protein